MTDELKLLQPITFGYNGKYYTFCTMMIDAIQGDTLYLTTLATEIKPTYNEASDEE